MIYFIKGKIIEKTPTYVVIDIGGIAYQIFISLNTFAQIGESIECKLLTHLSIKEDSHILYGFFTEKERKIFKHLISVNGVGATTAQIFLSSIQPDLIAQCIQSEDVNTLKTVKGIGLKTAQRIIIELKDKMEKENYNNIEKLNSNYNKTKNESLQALVQLGFDRSKSNKVIEKLIENDPTIPVEELVKLALKSF